jgi:RimJ/RimL family protein N-acetyltransferase
MITMERLILRPWEDGDLHPYAEMNADPRVREFFPSVLTREQSDAEVRFHQSNYERDGFCFFAGELIGSREFVGFVGLQTMNFVVPSLPQLAVEIGWTPACKHWGKGLATEGARGVIRYASETLNLRYLVAITVPANHRSRHVMEKIGMKHIPQLDFDHPRVPKGHPLRTHVLYSMNSDVASVVSQRYANKINWLSETC